MFNPDVDALTFSKITLTDLDTLTESQLDELPFGVIGLSADNHVLIYNDTEVELAGLSASSIIGSDFFLSTAQCMNNFLVAQRFEDETELDATIDYVLTLRMRPTPVRLRMLQGSGAQRHYILIQR